MWRWPNFSGLTIFEFINHHKLTFFSARTCPNFSHFSHHVRCALPFDFALEKEARKTYFIISKTQRIIQTRFSIFYYLIDMNIYTRNLPVCNSGQYTCVTDLCNFFFVLQDLIDRIDSYFQRIGFLRNLFLIGFTSQVFPDEDKQPSLEWCCVNL